MSVFSLIFNQAVFDLDAVELLQHRLCGNQNKDHRSSGWVHNAAVDDDSGKRTEGSKAATAAAEQHCRIAVSAASPYPSNDIKHRSGHSFHSNPGTAFVMIA